ncbi:MAG TPA: hypothetical protein ENG61_03900 [Candidatus Korarchaeota archaeon]|nr:hypothetical protein [Candidatus Korarchaeota archaeon]
MNREIGEAIRTLIFVSLLLASTAISVSLAHLRVKNFGNRLATSLVILSERASEHKVEITLELPDGNYSLLFFDNGSALFSMGGYKVLLEGFPSDLGAEIRGGRKLHIGAGRSGDG